METIDTKLHDYVWKNINKVESIFPKRAYDILLKLKKGENKQSFSDTLEIILDFDEEILKKIEGQYEDIESMSMDKIIDSLKIINDDDHLDKEKYLKRAKYLIDTYRQKDEKYSDILNNLAITYYIMGLYKEAEPLYLDSLKIRKNILGGDHPKIGRLHIDLALLYKSMGNENKSMSSSFKSLKMFENIFSNNYKLFLEVHRNIESIVQSFNKYFFLNKKSSNLNFKIDKVKLNNFKQYKPLLEIYFSNRMNIIIGQNAIGKTTLLQAITLGLLKENSADEETGYSNYITKGETESKIIISHNNSEKVVKILKDRREIDNNYFIPFVLAYGSNFFTRLVAT